MNHRRYLILLVIAFAFLASGCASMPAANSDAQDDPVDAGGGAEGLYEGEPEVVFATEFPVGSADEAIARADRALTRDEVDLALYLYVRAYDLDSDSRYALRRIAQIHESRKNNELASRAYAALLRIDPDDVHALQALGLMYLNARRHDEARAFLDRAVASEPSLWRAHNGLGVIADMQGDHERAVRAYDAALEVRPGSAFLLNNRGYSKYMAGNYHDAAMDFIAAAAEGSEKAWLNLGLVLARQKEYEKAVKAITRVAEPPVAFNDVGYVAMRQGDHETAVAYFEEAIRLSPRYFEAADRNLQLLQNGRATKADRSDPARPTIQGVTYGNIPND